MMSMSFGPISFCRLAAVAMRWIESWSIGGITVTTKYIDLLSRPVYLTFVLPMLPYDNKM